MEKSEHFIFIVDDDRRFNRLIELGLLKHGFKNTKSFFNGESCIKNLRLQPDVIILDYHLDTAGSKVKTGLQIVEIIKRELPNTMIIMLSGEMQKEPERFTDPRFITNIDRYLVKGIDNIKELVETITESDDIYYQ